MTDKEKLEKLIDQIKNHVPYIIATLSPGCIFDVEKMSLVSYPNNTKDWMAVHRGRAGSSIQQLQHLLKLVEQE